MDGFDDKAARTVCRMLGHEDGLAILNSAFGWNVTPINISHVVCTGNEKDLMDCDMITETNCTSGLYSSVYCSNETLVDTGKTMS